MRRALVAVLLLRSSPALAQIEGRARAVSGDVLEMGGRPWTCGLQAAFALAGLVERHWLTCVARGRNEAGRVTAVCRTGGPAGVEVNARMVAEGWALADPATGGAYAGAQEQAKAARRGPVVGALRGAVAVAPGPALRAGAELLRRRLRPLGSRPICRLQPPHRPRAGPP